jgi:hypothetical protein
VVILSQVLPSPCTVGYEELNALVVKSVNGMPIKDLAEIEIALAQSTDGFHRIDFQGPPGQVVIDARQAAETEPVLMKNYGLPAIKRLN